MRKLSVLKSFASQCVKFSGKKYDNVIMITWEHDDMTTLWWWHVIMIMLSCFFLKTSHTVCFRFTLGWVEGDPSFTLRRRSKKGQKVPVVRSLSKIQALVALAEPTFLVRMPFNFEILKIQSHSSRGIVPLRWKLKTTVPNGFLRWNVRGKG
jgi:hypothetical protein